MPRPHVGHDPRRQDLAAPGNLAAHHGRGAKQTGLIGYVVADGSTLEKALEIAEMINNNGPLAVQAILRTIHETEGMHENNAFKIDTQIGIKVFLSDDAKEGALAFRRSAPRTSRCAEIGRAHV